METRHSKSINWFACIMRRLRTGQFVMQCYTGMMIIECFTENERNVVYE